MGKIHLEIAGADTLGREVKAAHGAEILHPYGRRPAVDIELLPVISVDTRGTTTQGPRRRRSSGVGGSEGAAVRDDLVLELLLKQGREWVCARDEFDASVLYFGVRVSAFATEDLEHSSISELIVGTATAA